MKCKHNKKETQEQIENIIYQLEAQLAEAQELLKRIKKVRT